MTPDAIRELQALPQWVCWRLEIPEGKTRVTKVPYQTNGEKAASNAPHTWTTYEAASRAEGFEGVGFVVAASDPYCGIDLDGCINAAGELADWAERLVELFASYTEITPSGQGLRIWIKGALPAGRRSKKWAETIDGEERTTGIEMYDSLRFFTITERHWGDTPGEIAGRQAELSALHAHLFPPKPAAARPPVSAAPSLADADLIEKAHRATNGAKFARLWRGDCDGYPSQSEAEYALCQLLRFWTGADPAAIERIARQSALYREQWDEPRGQTTWIGLTIANALADGGEIYDPARYLRETPIPHHEPPPEGRNGAHLPLSAHLSRNGAPVVEIKSKAPFVPENHFDEEFPRFPRFPRTSGLHTKPDEWPAPLAEEALYGLAGDFIRAIAPHTEADPAALLASLLCITGSVMGLGPHMRVGPKVHRLREFVALVGPTSSGRKGTSMEFGLELAKLVDPSWQYETGLSSGEGLIWMVRDEITKQIPLKEKGKITGYQHEIVDPGVLDKRRLVIEEEFASVLRAAGREGNTLSAILRTVWDRDNYQSLTKNSPAKATGAHVSCLVHITPEELRRNLTEVEVANGFANRFLWICSTRARLLPDGGEQVNLQSLADDLSDVLRLTRMHACELRRDKQASAVWKAVYPELTMDRPGMLGAVTSRAEAHVLRLSGIYAALDGGREIRLPHLLAALAVWDYASASARYLFGDRTGDPVADILLHALREAAPEGLARNAIREDVFQKHTAAEKIDEATEMLVALGQVQVVKENTGGRPRHMLYSTGGQKGRSLGILQTAKAAVETLNASEPAR